MRADKPTGIFQKGLAVLNNEGLSKFIARSCRYVSNSIFNVTFYNAYQIDTNSARIEDKTEIADCFHVFVSSRKQVDELITRGFDFRNDPAFCNYEAGFRGGSSVFLVFVRKMLAHTSWVAVGHEKVTFDALFRSLDFGQAGYIGPCNTYEGFRGLGLYPFALTNIFKFLREQGTSRAVISTREDNEASIRGIVKAGFTPLCTVKRIRIFYKSIFVRKGKFE